MKLALFTLATTLAACADQQNENPSAEPPAPAAAPPAPREMDCWGTMTIGMNATQRFASFIACNDKIVYLSPTNLPTDYINVFNGNGHHTVPIEK